VTDFVEKPQESERLSNLSSLPLYVLTKDIFTALERLGPSPRGEYELPEVFREYIRTGKVVHAVRASNRFDLTDQSDLLALNELFLKELTPACQVHPSVTIPPSAAIYPPVLIEEGATIGENTIVGPLAYIERNAVIEPGCTVSHTVVLRGARITKDAKSTVVV
jgi:NDP-sugar pyrophosphorylase family protein